MANDTVHCVAGGIIMTSPLRMVEQLDEYALAARAEGSPGGVEVTAREREVLQRFAVDRLTDMLLDFRCQINVDNAHPAERAGLRACRTDVGSMIRSVNPFAASFVNVAIRKSLPPRSKNE